MKSNPRIFISAGEPSGDLHAASLVRAIKAARPGAEFAALGGNAMESAGAALIHNMLGQFAVMGFIDALRVLPAIRRLRDETLTFLDGWKPDAAVLVDYPGFNLNLAYHLKERGIRVFYYICPQVWAWAPGRIRKIAARVDKALVVFPFEADLYRHGGIPVEYVGHPLGDVFAARPLDREFVERGPLAGAKLLVALLPGSRTREIRVSFPVKAEAALIIKAEHPGATFAVPVTTVEHARIVEGIAKSAGLDCTVLVEKAYEVMSLASFAITTSGTATLELAHFGVPMVVLYRTNPGGLFVKKFFIRTEDIALVNIVAGRRIVPELVYWLNHARTIARMSLEVLDDAARLEAMSKDVRAAGALIDSPGASKRAAAAILGGLDSEKA